MQKIFNKSNKTILLTTAIYIAYTIFIIIPFLKYAAPQNEGTIDWKFKYAPFVFAGLFYPIFCYGVGLLPKISLMFIIYDL